MFCGGTDIRCDNHGKVSRDRMHRDDDVWSMCCYNCGATFPNRYRRELLVEAWNRRVADGGAAEIERLCAVLKGIEVYATSKDDAKGMAAKALLDNEQSAQKSHA